MLPFRIRPSRDDDLPFLREMLRVAASWRGAPAMDGAADAPMGDPELAVYLEDWGRRGDRGYVAEVDGRPVGAAWTRLFTGANHGYGFVDEDTPELSVAVLRPHRGRGVGTALVTAALAQGVRASLDAVSLSVEPDNPAVRLYERAGFRKVGEVGGSWTMVVPLPDARTDDLALAHRLADAADEVTRAAFVLDEAVGHDLKPDGTPVSATDREVEETLLGLVRRYRPDDAFLGEEVGDHGDGRRCWVIDGIDGTVNFVAGRPLWGTLIALVEDGVPMLGMNSAPAQRLRTWAARGSGAWEAKNDGEAIDPATQLSVAAPREDRELRANLELAWPTHPLYGTVERMSSEVEQLAMTTHPGLMVAAGELDLAVQLGGGPWDFAAIMAIVWEAGGSCLDLDGREVAGPEAPMVHAGGVELETVRRLLGG